ncbi:MAG: hypothetical protein DMD59_14435 [Gemmatimonadetes bacterium]|nr:MAG: hypothetical protein DMD59_14435 [Gemmatimonadota bacterium]
MFSIARVTELSGDVPTPAVGRVAPLERARVPIAGGHGVHDERCVHVECVAGVGGQRPRRGDQGVTAAALVDLEIAERRRAIGSVQRHRSRQRGGPRVGADGDRHRRGRPIDPAVDAIADLDGDCRSDRAVRQRRRRLSDEGQMMRRGRGWRRRGRWAALIAAGHANQQTEYRQRVSLYHAGRCRSPGRQSSQPARSVITPPRPSLGVQTAPVLCYHRIGGPLELGVTRVSRSVFARQMTALARAGWRTLTLEEFARHAVTVGAQHAAPLHNHPSRELLLSFDDGYASLADNAYPVLADLGFTATTFLITDYIGKTNTWDVRYTWHRLRHLSWLQIEAWRAREGARQGRDVPGAHRHRRRWRRDDGGALGRTGHARAGARHGVLRPVCAPRDRLQSRRDLSAVQQCRVPGVRCQA